MNRVQKFFAVLAVSLSIVAAAPEAQAASHRMDHKFGVYADILGDPFIGFVGANVAFNLLDFLRLSGGYNYLTASYTDTGTGGTLTGTVHSFGGQAKFLVPSWNFSPYLGIGAGLSIIGGNIQIFGQNLGATLAEIFTVTYAFGFDWQTGGGFNLGFGARFPWDPANNTWAALTDFLPIIPHIYLGWYF